MLRRSDVASTPKLLGQGKKIKNKLEDPGKRINAPCPC
jgi:hypothetical protein